MKSLVVAAVGMLQVSLGGPQAEVEPEQPTVITQPDWLERPSPTQFWAFYPAEARREGKAGRVTIRCEVTVIGTLTGCSVVSEEPAELGFGQAGIALSQYFRMQPQTRNGEPVGGAAVNIPIHFDCDRDCRLWASQPTVTVYFNLPWTQAPSLEQWAQAYPARARSRAPNGVTMVECQVANEGRLQGCFAVEESPAGLGFGRAASELARNFVAPTADHEGNSTRGWRVRLKIAFPSEFARGERPTFGQPRILQRPADHVLASLFPAQAREQDIRYGRVVLDCLRTTAGEVVQCDIAEETPTDAGFGAAAILVSRYVRTDLWSDDGRMTAPRLLVPIEFGSPESDPNSPLSGLSRAVELALSGRVEDAAAELGRLRQSFGDDAILDPFGEAAVEAEDAGLILDALHLSQSLTIAAPDKANYWASICRLKLRADIMIESAVTDCDRALQLEPGSTAYLQSRGAAHLKVGENELALRDFEQALVQQETSMSLYGRGISKLRMGDATGGNEDLRRANREFPNLAETFFEIFGVRP